MKKKSHRKAPNLAFLKLDLKMKLTLLLVFTTIFSMFAESGYSQEITLDVKDITVRQLIDRVEGTTDFRFVYNTKFVDLNRKISVKAKAISITELLNSIFKNTSTSFEVRDTQIILKQKTLNKPGTIKNTSLKLDQRSFVVRGMVKDNNEQPLPGANIVEKGTSNGTQTDFDGNFEIMVEDEDAVLIVSFLGFVTKEVIVDGRSSLELTLQEDSAKLDEVVVVGYGTQKVTNLTGSVAVISEDQLENRQVNNTSNLLAGLGAGITVVSDGGSPGSDGSSISIRGNTTFGGSNEPLVIIDGVEAALDNIDPNDIESISVLKDASASAIYGVRGGNGVVVVKTKRGKEGKISVNLNTSIGFQDFTFLPNYVNSYDYAILANEALTNDGLAPAFDTAQLQGFQTGTLPNTNWIDAIQSGPGTTQRYHLSLSGGSEKISYNASLGYLDTDGLITNTNYKRYNLRVNIDQKISKRLNVAYNLALSRRDASEPSVPANAIFFNAYRSAPIYPIRNSDGNFVGINNQFNAVGFAELSGIDSDINDEFIGSVKASYELVKGLTFNNISAVTQRYRTANNWAKTYSFYDESGALTTTNQNGVEEQHFRSLDINIQNFLNYEITLGKNNLNFLLGHHSIKSDANGLLTSINGLPENNTSNEIALGNPETLIADSQVQANRLESYFGRLNYNFDEKYLFEASFRHDATSRFAPENRSEFFPSFSVGWNLGKEEFFKSKTFNTLKLRGSWGQLGNQDITDLAFAPIYVPGRDLWLGGINQNSLIEGSSNPDLTWETITKTNVGVDVSLLDYKVNFSADYFIEDREDILALEALAGTFGATAPLANVGNSNAEGIEANLNFRGEIGNDFKYSANFNTTYFTKIPTVSGLTANAEIPGRSNGDPISNIFGFTALGLFQSDSEIASAPDQSFFGGTPVPGDIRYSDINGDNVVDGNDRSSLGTYSPELFYGVSFNADFKDFDFSFLLQGVGKVKNVLSGRAAHFLVNDSNAQERHLDRWTPSNPNASYPILHAVNGGRNENEISSFFVYDASYLRLKNIQFGYSLPEEVTEKLGIEKLRLFFSGENLLTFVNSDYPDGFDPETISTFSFNEEFGGDTFTPITPVNTGFIYPQTKTYTFGLNLAF
ncbi:TonB-dependent receptor [Flagellimonas sp.]|uniref:TonB-dependent receptor n=1 Tax=Flagellimonas sp. TaxID=2058762 RepID=UPI003BB101A0